MMRQRPSINFPTTRAPLCIRIALDRAGIVRHQPLGLHDTSCLKQQRLASHFAPFLSPFVLATSRSVGSAPILAPDASRPLFTPRPLPAPAERLALLRTTTPTQSAPSRLCHFTSVFCEHLPVHRGPQPPLESSLSTAATSCSLGRIPGLQEPPAIEFRVRASTFLPHLRPPLHA